MIDIIKRKDFLQLDLSKIAQHSKTASLLSHPCKSSFSIEKVEMLDSGFYALQVILSLRKFSTHTLVLIKK